MLEIECMVLKGTGFWCSLEYMNRNTCCENMSMLKCSLMARDGAIVI